MKEIWDNLPPAVRDPRRFVPGIAALLAVIVVAVYLPSRAASERKAAERDDVQLGADNGAVDGAGDTSAGDTVGEAGTPGAPGAGATGDGTPGSGGGGGSARPGAATGGGSASGASVSRASYQGVTDKTIDVLFAWQHQPCGQDPTAFISKALPQPDADASINTAVRYFNKHAKEAFGRELSPQLASQIGTGLYGRTVRATIVDDHGGFCPEQSRADSQQAADKVKPFASIGGSDEWDDEMTRRRIVRVTGAPLLDEHFRSKRPYLWGPITGASTINRLLGGYAAKYLKGVKATNTGDPTISGKDRVFGLISMDSPNTNKDTDDLKKQFAKHGVPIARAVTYEPKLETIGEQATNIILQLKQAGVTTIFMAMDPIAVQFIAQSADSQQYRPEWISNTYGLMDWSLGPRSFMSTTQAANTFGISVFWPSRQVREEDTEDFKVWNAENPGVAVPGDWTGWYSSIKLLFRGMALAGPNLTPGTLEHGYNTQCNPCARANPLDPLIGYGPGDFTATDDAHRQKYDPNAPDYAAAKSSWSEGQPPKGAYVYLDGGRRTTSFG